MFVLTLYVLIFYIEHSVLPRILFKEIKVDLNLSKSNDNHYNSLYKKINYLERKEI